MNSSPQRERERARRSPCRAPKARKANQLPRSFSGREETRLDNTDGPGWALVVVPDKTRSGPALGDTIDDGC